jgi:hypothetical protein
VAWLRSANQGRDFQVVEEPKPAPVMAPAPVPTPAPETSEAWEPGIMDAGLTRQSSMEPVKADEPKRARRRS